MKPSLFRFKLFLTGSASLLIAAAMLFPAAGCGRQPERITEGASPNLVQPDKWWEILPRPVYASLDKVETSQPWFEVYRLPDGTYAIYEPGQFEEAMSYLVIGSEKAALIDTGTGIGDLRSLVEGLTELPVMVINTHTHWDHIGADRQFDDVRCFDHPECIAKLTRGVGREKLMPSVTGDALWKPLPEGFDALSFSIPPVEPTFTFQDGDRFDLGGRKLEVIHTPGHSPGSVCLLDRDNRVLFCGDTFFPGPLYAYSEDVDLDLYIESIDRLLAGIGDYDHLCAGHNDPWVKSEVIGRVATAFQTILSGEGRFDESGNIRRYYFDGFDILIRPDQIQR